MVAHVQRAAELIHVVRAEQLVVFRVDTVVPERQPVVRIDGIIDPPEEVESSSLYRHLAERARIVAVPVLQNICDLLRFRHGDGRLPADRDAAIRCAAVTVLAGEEEMQPVDSDWTANGE